MKGRPIDQLVYECMFPKPKAGDPQNFQAFLQRNLVPEVRLETTAFYGHLSSQEAKYPGLDYSHQPHRVRLSRFQWHRRLFRAFDNLRLTKSEIASLTKWEGTRWAKERFEKEEGVIIRDTTGDGIDDWVPPELRVTETPHALRADVEDMEEDGQIEENDIEEGDGESDTEIQSVGIELNERLRAAVAQREAGNSSIPLDEEWEQWLKDAVEHGYPIPNAELSPNANIPGTRPAPERPLVGTLNPYHHSIEQAIAAHHSRRRLRELSLASARSPSPSTPVNYRVGVNTSVPIGSYHPRLDQRRLVTGIEYHIREAPYTTSSVPSLPPPISRMNISSSHPSQSRSS